jgi:dihydrofolate reductase
MAKLTYGLNQSLDGNVDHTKFRPELGLFQHFIDYMRSLDGIVYGRGMYEVMRYWDDDQPDWEQHEHDFAAAWRSKPKWVLSRSLKEVGPNATLINDDAATFVRKLKSEQPGQIEVNGPHLAQSLTDAGLIDEYRIYLHPVVVGSGTPFFLGACPPLHLAAADRLSENVIRLTYTPAP